MQVRKGSRLLLLVDSADIPYAKLVQGLTSNFVETYVRALPVANTVELAKLFADTGADCLATTRIGLMKKIDPTLEGTAAENYGYYMEAPAYTGKRPVLMLPPLKSVVTQNFGNFLMGRYLRKLYAPNSFMHMPPMRWELGTQSNAQAALAMMQKARLISVDIETKRDPLLMTSVSYTAWFGGADARTIVFPVNADTVDWVFDCIHQFNLLPAPKLLQNGQYDIAWFMRFNVPLHNYLFDTYNAMHCWYPELDKDLAFIASFTLLNFRFWKDEASKDLYEYNAKDTHNTLFAYLAMMAEYPAYASRNYLQEFPLVFPALHCGLEGIAVDQEERMRLRAIEQGKVDSALGELRQLIGVPEFNPGSSQQVLKLMHALGYKQAAGTDKIEMQKFSEAHPLFTYAADLIRKYRKAVKAISTYYDMTMCCNRLIYKIDPAGTDSGRLASQSSPFWTGTQIQNIPAYCKDMFIPDPGWLMSEVDNSQSESRCTAYISEDLRLIDTVENSPDFHCTNASLFFGIPFEELFDISTSKVLRKDIRTVSKRVNHGANYNMGPDVLVDTMGTAEVLRAGRLLKLPAAWRPRRIAEHLLECFHAAYPNIAGKYYKEVIAEIVRTGFLVGATGWTRRTFLQPTKSKLDLNSAVAHAPQSLSVMLVNKAYFRVWKELQIKSKSQRIRLKAQIHDSLFFQYPVGGEAVVQEVSELMKIPCVVNGRTMIIPNDPKFGAARWGALKD